VPDADYLSHCLSDRSGGKEWLKIDGHSFLAKPINISELVGAIEQHLPHARTAINEKMKTTTLIIVMVCCAGGVRSSVSGYLATRPFAQHDFSAETTFGAKSSTGR
jgi:hypothetical protein